MEIEQEIYFLLSNIIPTDAVEFLLFCEAESTAYEMKFYVRFTNGLQKDCYTLAEQGLLNEDGIDNMFQQIYEKLILTKEFNPQKRNVFTFKTDRRLYFFIAKQYDRAINLYLIKQEWRKKYLSAAE